MPCYARVRLRPVRVKDFVDILLFAGLQSDLQADRLLVAIQVVFQAGSDQILAELEHIPAGWQPKYNQFTRNLDLPFDEFDQAVQAAQDFINPILDGTAHGIWDAILWESIDPD